MIADMRQRGLTALDYIPEKHLPTVVKWLELLAETQANPDVETEELWLLANGELEQIADEAAEATPIDDWQKYLGEGKSTS